MHNEVRHLPSRVGVTSKRHGTFSYLPALDPAALRNQVTYMVQQGWNCAIEHVEPTRASDRFWSLWKLPMFGERDPVVILAEISACQIANPRHLVRLVGLDNHRQTQGLAMVVALPGAGTSP